MKAYILSSGNISPQHSLDKDAFFQSPVKTSTDFYRSLEPDYDAFVDSKMIRRMSRIVKMGVASAITCLRNANVSSPAAILTATAYGCLEDTSSFLRRMIEFDERMLSPTAFIQSTHNTVGAQIALLLKCHNYNNTIVHRSFSFENALIESGLLLEEGMGQVLIGAVDEITNDSHAILSRFGLYRRRGKDRGNIAGEGAAFFLLDKEAGDNNLAVLTGVETIYNPINTTTVYQTVKEFLYKSELKPEDVDLILTSHTGDKKQDESCDLLLQSLFPGKPHFPYKSLCGDYPTASGFALWLSSILLHEQKAPTWMQKIKFPLQNILIYNKNGEKSHSFILISAS